MYRATQAAASRYAQNNQSTKDPAQACALTELYCILALQAASQDYHTEC